MKKWMLLLGLIGMISSTAHASNESYTGLHQDLPVGEIDGTALTINIAFPSQPTKDLRPVILMIHGGGFVSGDKNSKNKQIIKFAQRGYVAASAMYRFAPEYKFPAQIEDIQLAVRYLKANSVRYGIDPEKIILSGSSAGSYLAMMVGVTGNSDVFSKHGLYQEFDSRVRAVAAQSAPIADFTLDKYRKTKTVERLLNTTSQNNIEALKAMSPVTYLDAEDPPFFLSHGDSDPVVSVDMSREFVQALEKINHKYEYHEIRGGTHSLSKSAPVQAKKVFSAFFDFIAYWAK